MGKLKILILSSWIVCLSVSCRVQRNTADRAADRPVRSDSVVTRLITLETLNPPTHEINLPELNFRLIPIPGTKEVAVQIPVIKETYISPSAQPTPRKIKIIDKSKTVTKDKSRENSGNKTKETTKTVTKDRPFPWWWVLVILAIFLLYRFRKIWLPMRFL